MRDNRYYLRFFTKIFFGVFIILTVCYKIGIRGYYSREAVGWDEIYIELPEIFAMAILLAIIATLTLKYFPNEK